MTTRTLGPEFFAGDPVQAARQLLGATLVHVNEQGQRMTGRIVEVEAYDCPRDPACTAGRFHLARSLEMSIPAGQWLFWAAHGHPLLQVSCREEGVSAGVLLRALEPLEGITHMLGNRPITNQRHLTNGPAKLVYALGLKPETVRRTPVNSGALHIVWQTALPDHEIEVTARIGLREGRNLPWRFCLRRNKWVSPAAPSMKLPSIER